MTTRNQKFANKMFEGARVSGPLKEMAASMRVVKKLDAQFQMDGLKALLDIQKDLLRKEGGEIWMARCLRTQNEIRDLLAEMNIELHIEMSA
jgi:23S rRNA U2552 (ribose-2'-O)-methylase RlmE/FtsJ